MNKKLKAKWVKALRSGKFKQGHLQLMDGDTYCCLGVLGAITGAPVERYGSRSYLPPQRACGLTKEQQEHLANMNDGLGGTRQSGFQAIANYIEKNL